MLRGWGVDWIASKRQIVHPRASISRHLKISALSGRHAVSLDDLTDVHRSRSDIRMIQLSRLTEEKGEIIAKPIT